LDQVYGNAKERIDSQRPGFCNLAKRVLSWITYAQKQLTTKELQHALAIEVGDWELDETNIPSVDYMVSVCAGLVTVDPESNIIRLVHYTTQKYFERILPTWNPNAPADIAKKCLTYLSFKTFASGCSQNDAEFEGRLTQNVFLSYAASHWAKHAREVQVDAREVALPLLKDESLVSASNQTMLGTTSRYRGYSQDMQTTGLHLAARFDLQEFVASLLEYNEYTNSKDTKYSRTPLPWAAENGHEAVVKLLLEKEGVGVDSKAKNGRTPLSWAAENGHEAVVKLLLEKEGVDVDFKDTENGQTPLSWAAEKGHEAVVRLLESKTQRSQ
jgi:hypothetical protein